MITSDVGPWGIIPRAMIAEMAGNTTAIALYALLSSYADRNGDDDWVGSRTGLAEELGISLATYKRALKALDEAGWVSVAARFNNDGDRAWNRYVVHLVNRGRLTSEPGSHHQRAGVGSPVSHVPQTPTSDPTTDTSRGGAVALVDTRFDEFWEAYPRKVGKPKAEAAYKKLLGEHDAVMAGLEEWSRYWRARGEPRFIPHPTTWLNRRGWEDEVDPLPGPKVPAGLAALMRSRQRYDERMSHEA